MIVTRLKSLNGGTSRSRLGSLWARSCRGFSRGAKIKLYCVVMAVCNRLVQGRWSVSVQAWTQTPSTWNKRESTRPRRRTSTVPNDHIILAILKRFRIYWIGSDAERPSDTKQHSFCFPKSIRALQRTFSAGRYRDADGREDSYVCTPNKRFVTVCMSEMNRRQSQECARVIKRRPPVTLLFINSATSGEQLAKLEIQPTGN